MARAAQADGIDLEIISATRNKNYQKGIWERKWRRASGTPAEKALWILRYSSMPGTSRHHWGTDFDIVSLSPSWWLTSEGERIYDWMTKNAASYGFYQPYTLKGDKRLTGYQEEKWHWSYAPTADRMLKAYNFLVDYNDIQGFEGSESARDIQVIENYVNGIQPFQ
jgi:LAS superfamily LD-carboxypeptidase LdcB